MFGSPSLQAVPGSAGPLATPSQSKVTAVPTHWQFAVHWSLIVFASPSLQDVPGEQSHPGCLHSRSADPRSCSSRPTSLPVFASPSLQAVPGSAGPVGHALAVEGHRRAHALAVRRPLVVDRVRITVVAGRSGRAEPPGCLLTVDQLTHAVAVGIPRVVARVRIAVVAGRSGQRAGPGAPSHRRGHRRAHAVAVRRPTGRCPCSGHRRCRTYPGEQNHPDACSRSAAHAVAVGVPRVVARVRITIVAGRSRRARPPLGAFAVDHRRAHAGQLPSTGRCRCSHRHRCRRYQAAPVRWPHLAVEGHRRAHALAVHRPLVVDRVRITVVAGRTGRAEPPGCPRSRSTDPRSCSSRPTVVAVFVAIVAGGTGSAGPLGASQSKVTAVPTHWQFAVHWSSIVFASPSLQDVPGEQSHPGCLRSRSADPRSCNWRPTCRCPCSHHPRRCRRPRQHGHAPTQGEPPGVIRRDPRTGSLPSHWSPVFAFPSLQAVPGSAGPLATPSQSPVTAACPRTGSLPSTGRRSCSDHRRCRTYRESRATRVPSQSIS